MPEKVFLSSTRQDLGPYREAVSRALLREGYFPVDMDNFTASPATPLAFSLQEVAESDLLVGIYARRYGFVPEGAETSITEQELRQAESLGIPCYSFLLNDDWPWPEDAVHTEAGEGARRLAALKDWIRGRFVQDTFTTPDNLVTKVMAALHVRERERRQAAELAPERRKLRELLDTVERYAREGIDEHSPRAGLLPLKLEERRHAVDSPREKLDGGLFDVNRPRRRRPLPGFFEKHGGRLLVLGRAGAGKSISLRQLALWLGGPARRDPARPVPLVLNLTAWNQSDQRLEDFLIREAGVYKYQVSEETLVEWLYKGDVVPLLDGLDEVAEDSRAACAGAIARYLNEHKRLSLVVCCRSSIYSQLERLPLHGAVELCPFDTEVLTGLLASDNPGTAALRQALAADAELREIARTPLMLFLLQEICTASGASALAAPPGTSPAELRRHVVGLFVSDLLQHDPNPGRYPVHQTRRALTWLACNLQAHGSQLFRAEQIQPSWLATRGQIWAYALISRGVSGALLMLPVVLWTTVAWRWAPPPALLLLGLVAGSLAGVVDALLLLRARSGKPPRQWAGRVLAIGAGTFLFCALAAAAGPLFRGGDPAAGLWAAAMYGPWLGLLFGLTFGLRPGWHGGGADTRIGERLVWDGWSRRGALAGAVLGAGLPLYFWALRALRSVSGVAEQSVFSAPFWLLVTAVSALAFAALGSRVGGFLPGGTPKIPPRRRIHRRIWAALKRAGAAAGRTVAAGTAVLVPALAAAALAGASDGAGLFRRNLLGAAVVAAGLYFSVLMWLRGLDLVQHLTLRALLQATSPLPWHWDRFLAHAADLNLLRKGGRAFQFFHAEVLEYFAFKRGPAPSPPPPDPSP